MKIRWMNHKAPKGQAYTPTEVEHFANVLTHGISILPSCFGAIILLSRSTTNVQILSACIYGSTLTLIFTISTFFHCVFFCDKHSILKDLLHRCDRAMIYVFIAGSYFPWLTLSPSSNPIVSNTLSYTIWILAAFGIIYQQIFHERYKSLETTLYIIMGIGPSAIILLSGHKFNGMDELKFGGILYLVGIFFFKADGRVPCAHAIWHLFVASAAAIHYYAILNYLYTQKQPSI